MCLETVRVSRRPSSMEVTATVTTVTDSMFNVRIEFASSRASRGMSSSPKSRADRCFG